MIPGMPHSFPNLRPSVLLADQSHQGAGAPGAGAATDRCPLAGQHRAQHRHAAAELADEAGRGDERVVEEDLVEVVGAGELAKRADGHAGLRSEEHTSELQSLMRNSYAVF